MAYLGNSPGVSSQRVTSTFTATAGQTTFTPISGYTLGYCDVYFNGVKLVDGDDYTASNGITVVLASGAALNDVVEVVAFFPRGLSDGYLKAEADAKYLTIANPSYTGTLTGGTGVINIGSGQLYKDGSGNFGVGTTSPVARLHARTGASSALSDSRYVVRAEGTSQAYLSAAANDYVGVRFPNASSVSQAYIDYYHGINAMIFGVNNAERARIDSSGVLSLAAGQIKFPASQNASSDANTLDDYEEGTWTPTINLLGTLTYGNRWGKYQKIGKYVRVSLSFSVSSTDTTQDGSPMQITGLPFTSASIAGSNYENGAFLLATEAMRGTQAPTSQNNFFGLVDSNATTVSVVQNNYNATISGKSWYGGNRRDGYTGGTMYLLCQFTYETNA
jgi:hypothetical protein